MMEEWYKSILFCKEPFDLDERRRDEEKFSRDMLTDLNLNQLFHSVSNGRNRGFVEELLKTPLNDPEEVYFRQAVFRDLECEALRNGYLSSHIPCVEIRSSKKGTCKCKPLRV